MPYTPFDITLGDHASTPTVVKQIQTLTHTIDGQVVNAYGSGEVFRGDVYQGKTPEKSSFRSTDLASLLALNTATFIDCGHDLVLGNTDLPFRKRAGGGKYATGASHLAIRGTSAYMTPDGLSASVDESASLGAMIHYRSSDGETPPTVELNGQTLSAAAPITSEFVLHSVVANGVAIPSLQGVEINPGLTIDDDYDGGKPYPIEYYLINGVPTLSITTEDLETATGMLNAGGLGSGVVVYLAKRKSKATFEDKASSVHIAITAATGMQQARTIGGDSRSNSSASVQVDALALTVAVGVAIP